MTVLDFVNTVSGRRGGIEKERADRLILTLPKGLTDFTRDNF